METQNICGKLMNLLNARFKKTLYYILGHYNRFLKHTFKKCITSVPFCIEYVHLIIHTILKIFTKIRNAHFLIPPPFSYPIIIPIS